MIPNNTHLPTHVNVLDIPWQINYIHESSQKYTLKEGAKILTFYGNLQNKPMCHKLLHMWVKKQAKLLLPQMLEELSQQMQLTYSRVRIRSQKTLWGSCTSYKSISLNSRLILLPRHLIRYVLIHELCHTQELNHSANFWALVAKFDPNWRAHRSELRKISTSVLLS